MSVSEWYFLVRSFTWSCIDGLVEIGQGALKLFSVHPDGGSHLMPACDIRLGCHQLVHEFQRLPEVSLGIRLSRSLLNIFAIVSQLRYV